MRREKPLRECNNTEQEWPNVREVRKCPLCEHQKRLGQLVCDHCRTTRTFLSMIDELTRVERSLRWNAERQTDRLALRRASDPPLTSCGNCGSTEIAYVRFEVPGKIVNGYIRPKIDYYAQCRECGMQTIPRPSKKLAAAVWNRRGDGVFTPTKRAQFGHV